MKIFRGPFHPHLETAFVDEIKQFKSADPLKPLLIIVPSDTLKRHIMKQLTLGHQLNLIDVTLQNFSELSQSICKEDPESHNLTLKDDLFLEETLRRSLSLTGSLDPDHSGDTDLSSLNRSEGGISALSQTIRDLKVGLVSPEIVTQALKEGHFGPWAMRGHLPRLFKQYECIKKTWQQHRFFDYNDLAIRATAGVSDSRFLKRFSGIFYYGFYDLTQILIDFLHILVKQYPATLFFPTLKNQPGWVFSERFFERYIEGLATSADQVIDLTEQNTTETFLPFLGLFNEEGPHLSPKPETAPHCSIINCFDRQDEVLTTAKEILRLIREEGFAFHDIGVVAREMTPYLSSITSCFQKHAIPLNSTCKAPFIQYPRAMAVLQLSRLLAEDFPRALCIDLINTPFFRTDLFNEDGPPDDRDTWDVISRKTGIKKSITSWERLKDQGQTKDPHLAKQADLLWRIISRLHKDLNALPLQSSCSDYAAQWEALLIKTLGFKTLNKTQKKSEALTHEEALNEGILNILQALAELDPVAQSVSRQDFIHAFQRGLKRALLPVSKENIPGVSVMDVSQARGVSFRVLFLLGLNEGVFPRAIREDPLLQDPHRRVLETVLGYKVGEKLAGYDEEKLLFTLMVTSAQTKLYGLYHRADGLGNPANPSVYLNELKKTFWEKDSDKEHTLPQSLIERRSFSPFNQENLSLPDEQAIYLSLTGQSCDAVLDHLPFSPALYLQGKKALAEIENCGALTAFDGLLASHQTHWAHLQNKGISPTRLETYAKCPFQYFSEKLLDLSRTETPEDETEAAPSDIGTLFHSILKSLYENLYQAGYFTDTAKQNNPRTLLTQISTTHFEQYESEMPPQYPLHWQETKTQIILILEKVIEEDFKAIAKTGYHPVAFEVEARQKIEADWPEFFGRIDRIDSRPDEGKVRVVDYKVTFRKSPKPREKNLLLSALRGERLQAPIYLRLAEAFAEEWDDDDEDQCTSAFYHIAPNWPDGPLVVSEFSQAGWHGESGDLLKTSISTLFEGLSSGKFFMKPGDYCGFCDVRTLCRQHHLPSRQRIEKDAAWQRHLSLQEIQAPKTGGANKKGSSK